MTELLRGKRMKVTEGIGCLFITSGNVEVYGISNINGAYRQLYLMELSAGEVIFPLYDDFFGKEIMIYATEDCSFEQKEYTDFDITELLNASRNWFGKLVHLNWVMVLADKNDDILSLWTKNNFLVDCVDVGALWKAFRYNQDIFNALLEAQLNSREKKYQKQVDIREKYRQYTMDRAVGNLLLEAEGKFISGSDTNKNDVICNVVKKVAENLYMPTEGIHLSSEITKRLDQLAIIRKLVDKANMQMRLVNLGDEWYKHDCGTLIAYYGEKKIVSAVIPVSEIKYKLINYEFPDGIIIDDSIAKNFENDAFQCYGGFPARKLSVKDLLYFMFKRSWKRDYITIITTSLVAGFIPVFSPVITETIFRDIIPIMDYQSLTAVTQIILLTGFATAALGMVRSIAVMRITNHLNMYVEAAMWGRLLKLPANFFRRFQSGELMNRMAGIGVVQSLVTGEFVGTVFNFVFSFWSILLMLSYSPILTVEAMAIWFIYFIIVAVIYRRIFGFQRKHIEAANKASGLVQQIFTGLVKFRVRGAEEQAFYLWSKIFGDEWRWNLKLRWQGNYNSIVGAIQPFILSMLLYYTVSDSMNEALAAGTPPPISYPEFMGFQAAFSAFNGTVVGIIPLAVQIIGIKPHVDNLLPILEAEPEISEDKVDADVLSGTVEISHLSFAYNDDGPDILKDINLKIRAKECVAIVGKSGCGKSTLMRLLLGMEKPKCGAVYYDGQDLAELNLSSVRSQLGVVLQNGQLMSGDIFTNIIGTSALTIDDAWAAAEKAGIADDIRRMPMGMYTPISEGSSNISGGQRQRILIARAIANKPAIVILDEATSALDNRTQAIVKESLDNMDTTRIIVAHRLSTIQNADRIIVIDNGTIAEEGSYGELLEKDGIFATLAKRQIA